MQVQVLFFLSSVQSYSIDNLSVIRHRSTKVNKIQQIEWEMYNNQFATLTILKCCRLMWCSVCQPFRNHRNQCRLPSLGQPQCQHRCFPWSKIRIVSHRISAHYRSRHVWRFSVQRSCMILFVGVIVSYGIVIVDHTPYTFYVMKEETYVLKRSNSVHIISCGVDVTAYYSNICDTSDTRLGNNNNSLTCFVSPWSILVQRFCTRIVWSPHSQFAYDSARVLWNWPRWLHAWALSRKCYRSVPMKVRMYH